MSSDDLKKRISFIDEESRLALGITRDEYAMCSYIYFRAQNTRQKQAGWCCDPKSEIADFCGIARRSFYNSLAKMEQNGLLIVGQNGHISPSETWVKVEQKCAETLRKILGKSVQFLHTSESKSVQNLHTSEEKSVQKLHSECAKIAHEEPKSVQNLHTHLIRDNKEYNKRDNTHTDVCFESSSTTDASARSIDWPAAEKHAKKEMSGAAVSGFTFEDFWREYDFKKGSKTNAQKKWSKLSAAEISAIKNTLEIYKRETVTEDQARGDKFKPMRKHPEFFLIAKTWEAYADAAIEEAARPVDEWDAPYQAYVSWVKSTFPNISKTAAYLTKREYICHKTENYVKDMVYIGQENIKNMLIRAHQSFEAGNPKAAQCGSVFAYQIHLLQERVKSRSV